MGCGKPGHFDDDLIVDLGVLRPWIAHENWLSEFVAIDANEAGAIRLVVGSDKLVRGAFNDLEDLAAETRAAGTRTSPTSPHANQIAGGGVAGLARRNVDVLVTANRF